MTDPFLRDAERLSDLLKRLWFDSLLQTESIDDNRSFSLIELIENRHNQQMLTFIHEFLFDVICAIVGFPVERLFVTGPGIGPEFYVLRESNGRSFS